MPALSAPSPGDDGSNDNRSPCATGSSSANDNARRRAAAQQAFLKEERRAFTARVANNPKDSATHAAALARLCGVLHRAKWHELEPFLQALRKVPDALPPNAVIILGGWLLPPPKGLDDGVVPAPDQLCFDLLSYELFSGVLARFEQSWKHGHVPGQEHLRTAYQDFVEEHRAAFGDRSPVEVAEKQVAILLPDLRRAFHFMENRAFLFSAIEGHPLRGWEDFLSFSNAYDAFPDHHRFEPYYLVIMLP